MLCVENKMSNKKEKFRLSFLTVSLDFRIFGENEEIEAISSVIGSANTTATIKREIKDQLITRCVKVEKIGGNFLVVGYNEPNIFNTAFGESIINSDDIDKVAIKIHEYLYGE